MLLSWRTLWCVSAKPGPSSTCGSTGRRTDPIAALGAVWRGWAPQMDDYVTRALDPTAAPTYGVPGDE